MAIRLDSDEGVLDLAKRVENRLLVGIEQLIGSLDLDVDTALILPGVEQRAE